MWRYFKQSIEKYLSSEGINIHSPYYKEAENYKRIAKERTIGPSEFGSMSMDEFIERFLLTKQEVAKTYESIYDMGNPQELTDAQCEDMDVAREIITKYTLIEEGDIDAEANDFVKKFYRNGGLLERIKRYLGLDLEVFDKNNKQFKRERCKILVSKKFVSFKKPMNPSKFQTHPAVLELFALCAIPAVSLKGRKNTSANNA